jgi:FtsZ-interacting cell division protein ZipA
MADLNETMMMTIIAVLALIFVALWIFSNKQKRKFEETQRKRKRDLAELKAKAAEPKEFD